MNSYEPIGGYFELELTKGLPFHENVILLQSARSCIDYLIKSLKIKKIYIPKYTCDVILQPIKYNDVDFEFYNIDNYLEITSKIILKDNEYLLYTNYFGVKNEYCSQLDKTYGSKLILDCSQAYFYSNYADSHIFYSPRKFFGVPDGGELYTKSSLSLNIELDYSYKRVSHLLKRIELGAEAGYEDFKLNDKKLDNQPIKHMSKLTQKILESIDYKRIIKTRRDNYNYLDNILSEKNELSFSIINNEVPMVYPFLVKNKNLKKYLIENKVYIPTYWPNVYEWSKEFEFERYLVDYLIAIPIDQRYNKSDMDIILRKIDECRH